MDIKRIIKNVAFIAFVPSVFVVGYYGYKAYKKYKEEGDDDEGRKKDSGKEELKGNKQLIKIDSTNIVKPTDAYGQQLVFKPTVQQNKEDEESK